MKYNHTSRFTGTPSYRYVNIGEGTLHIAGHDNHLYGLCAFCLGVRHLGVLGPDYNIWFNPDTEEYEELDAIDILTQDLLSDPWSVPEAYAFELVDVPLPDFNIQEHTQPCVCELHKLYEIEI